MASTGRAILIIDDEEALARNVSTFLQRLGWTTQVAHSAEEGLARCTEFRPDVVLLDHNLPAASGLEILPRLKAMDPQLRVVMATGYGSTEHAVTAMREGAADYLTKPLVLGELRLLLDRLVAQQQMRVAVDYYQARERDIGGLDKIVGESPAICDLRRQIATLIDAERRLVDGEMPTVLIHGETGTGKELVARALHVEGPRSAHPFVELNCGALPPQLLEAELFGYERGAFTDARQRKTGLLEAAEGGTLFLDEIGEADPAIQVKLLKVLEDKRFRRLGGVREQQVSLRIIGATHRRLDQMVQEGRFRADLYFRLRIVEITVPPLRERQDDVVRLAQHFLRQHAGRYRLEEPVLTAAARQRLLEHPWPGNVRELRNSMEQALLRARGPEIGAVELGFLEVAGGSAAASAGRPLVVAADSDSEDLNLERAERRLISRALERCAGNVTQAARLLGISRDTLRYRLERLRLRHDEF